MNDILRPVIIAIFFYFLARCLTGCGGDNSSQPISTPSAIQGNQVLAQNLPTFEKQCVDNNEALFPSQYANCVPVFGADHCTADQTTNTLALEAKWQDIKSWATASFDYCLANGNTGDYCFAVEEMELSRRSEWDCLAVVHWL